MRKPDEDKYYKEIVEKAMDSWSLNSMAHEYIKKNANNENKVIYLMLSNTSVEVPFKVLKDLYKNTCAYEVKEKVIEILIERLGIERKDINDVIDIFKDYKNGK